MRVDIFRKTVTETFEAKRDRRLELIKAMMAMTDDKMILNNLEKARKLATGEFSYSRDNQDYRKTKANIEKQKEYINDLQRSTDGGRNKYQQWTTAEIYELMNSEDTDAEIAKKLGRSLYGVNSKRKKLYAAMG